MRARGVIALSKNHHWAMDQYLIAPGPRMTWEISGRLVGRLSPGEAELVQLAGEPVLPPKEEIYAPSQEGLEWRARRMANADTNGECRDEWRTLNFECRIGETKARKGGK